MPSPRLTPLTENVAVWPRLGTLRSVISAFPSPSPTAQSIGGPALIHVSERRGAAPGGRGNERRAVVDWSLFGFARKGHVTYAPHEPDLRDRLMAPTAGEKAWRCLRCGTF